MDICRMWLNNAYIPHSGLHRLFHQIDLMYFRTPTVILVNGEGDTKCGFTTITCLPLMISNPPSPSNTTKKTLTPLRKWFLLFLSQLTFPLTSPPTTTQPPFPYYYVFLPPVTSLQYLA